MAKIPGRNKNYIEGPCKILWIVDGVVRQEINRDNPTTWHIANWQAERLKETTHRSGKLKVVSVNEKIDAYQTKLHL
jgi:hypothetical protein